MSSPNPSPVIVTSSRDEGGLLVLDCVRKRWGAQTVLRDVGLSVQRGSVVSIGGANGAGKTTLLRIAAGLIRPESGTVEVDGLHPERDRRSYLRRTALLSAGDRALYARLSPRRHLDLGARLALLSAGERRRAVQRSLARFALDEFADRRADRLSTGQRQRVRLAMALVHDPELVLLDEPANSLDRSGLELLTAYLDDLCARGGAGVWCAPESSATPLGADTALRLADGELRPA